MKTLKLHNKDIYRGSLILVNKEYPIRMKLSTQNLASINGEKNTILMETRVKTILQQCMNALFCTKQIVAVSGFRSLHEQKEIYENSLMENGKEFTEKFVALPNHSEHQTGLAIDLAENRPNIDFIRPYFPYKGICQKFREKAPLFGFIERYQKSKEKITGISHEPWHFRYVGFPHSTIMTEKKLSLEEYVELLKQYPYKKQPLIYPLENCTVEISYVKAAACDETTIDIPNNTTYQISGNNMDGFIVTTWRNKSE